MDARPGRITGVILLAVVLLTAGWMLLKGATPGSDAADYRAAGERFVLGNGIIARQIGKVERLDHFGDGGGGGDVSYNVYRLYGTEKTAVCQITLRRNERSRWEVTEAVLSLEGVDYRIPIRKAEPGRFMRFSR